MSATESRTVRIGCAAAFWGDTRSAARQLIDGVELDYIVFDYLAEITMSILARARTKDPSMGYARDFVAVAGDMLADCVERGIKVASNAGGINPAGCRDALAAELERRGIEARIAIVLGDDLLADEPSLREAGVTDMFTGDHFPEAIVSMNAYLGATPIAAAFADGADIVLTGRCVDSALILGPLMHEFGWGAADYDLLSSGSLLGHLVECGPQVTGGVHTDWMTVPAFDEISFPVLECHPDGSGVVTKVPGAGGLVTPATVAEQMLYEIGDPTAYLLPDVACDWTQVELSAVGEDRVLVRGAVGKPSGPSYKVSATYRDGYRATTTLTLVGGDAAGKAQAVADSILLRCSRLLAEAGLEPFDRTSVEIIGSDTMYGARGRRSSAREVVLKVAVHHSERAGASIFGTEVAPALTSTAPGITGFFTGRPAPVDVVRLFSFLIPKSQVDVSYELDGQAHPVAVDATSAEIAAPAETGVRVEELVTIRLSALAYARSGDKADLSNIGVIARRPEYVDLLREYVTDEFVARTFSHFVKGTVTRYELPGTNSFNFVLTEALDGGGVVSLRMDPQGKAFGPILLDQEVELPLSRAVAAGAVGTP
jgi:hypothetical protein